MRWPWQKKLRPPFDEIDRFRTVALADMDIDKYGWSDDTAERVRGFQQHARDRIAAFPDQFKEPEDGA
jgi:hypothetical protein